MRVLLLLSRDVSSSPGFQALSYSVIHGALVFLVGTLGVLAHDRLAALPVGMPGSLNLTLAGFVLIPVWCASGWLTLLTAREVYGDRMTAAFWTSQFGVWLLFPMLFMVSYAVFLKDTLQISLSMFRAQGGDINQAAEYMSGLMRTLLFVLLGHYAAAVALLTFPLAWYKLNRLSR